MRATQQTASGSAAVPTHVHAPTFEDAMKVIICHSGALSVAVAHAVRKALRRLFPHGEPFMSDQDIEPGAIWHQRLSSVLCGTSAAIICLTRNNVSAPWLHYEAGAVATTLGDKARVVPILIDLHQAEVKGPLMHFQSLTLKQEDMLRLVHTLDDLSDPPRQLPRAWLEDLFTHLWPGLQRELDRACKDYGGGEREPVSREQEMFRTIVELLQSRVPGASPGPSVQPPPSGYPTPGYGQPSYPQPRQQPPSYQQPPAYPPPPSYPTPSSGYPPSDDYPDDRPRQQPYGEKGYPPTPSPSQPQPPAEPSMVRQVIWVQARDTDPPGRLEDALKAVGIASPGLRHEGDAVAVSWLKTDDSLAAEDVAAALEKNGFKVAAIGEPG
jgi:hypothetical protein